VRFAGVYGLTAALSLVLAVAPLLVLGACGGEQADQVTASPATPREQAAPSSPSSGLIAFTRPDGVYAMRADGSGVRAVRRGGAAATATSLAWSPDGTKLAFHDYAGTIWVMNADGSGLTRVVAGSALEEPAAPGSPAWTPGGRIGFTVYFDGDRDIWTVEAGGQDPQRLARTPERIEIEAAWSPDGNRIAATSDGYLPAVYVMNADGREATKIAHQDDGGLWFFTAQPQWSPDSRRIAFMHWEEPPGELFPTAEVYVTELESGSLVRLTSNRVPDTNPVWSPDGTRIAFLRWAGTARELCLNCQPDDMGPSDIYVMNADGTGVTRLTDSEAPEGSPAWQPPSGP
jgi:TolB protein